MTKLIIGWDFALSKQAIIASVFNSNNEHITNQKIFLTTKKSDVSISLKDNHQTVSDKLNSILENVTNNVTLLASELGVIEIYFAVDASAKVHFNSRRIQTYYTGFCLGYIRKYCDNLGYNVFFIEPKEIRYFLNLKGNESKEETQKAYLALPDFVISNRYLNNDDYVDAVILAYYLSKNLKG